MPGGQGLGEFAQARQGRCRTQRHGADEQQRKSAIPAMTAGKLKQPANQLAPNHAVAYYTRACVTNQSAATGGPPPDLAGRQSQTRPIRAMQSQPER